MNGGIREVRLGSGEEKKKRGCISQISPSVPKSDPAHSTHGPLFVSDHISASSRP